MERKELISELKLIRNAVREKKEKLEEKYPDYWFDSDYELHMDHVPTAPIEPTEPQRPRVPANEKDRFLQEEDIPSFEEYKEKNYRKTKFELSGWRFKLTIAGAIIGALIILVGLNVLFTGRSDLKYAHEWFSNIANQDQIYDQYMYEINTANDVISAGVTTIIVGGCVALISALISLSAAFVLHKSMVKNNENALEESYKNYTVRINKSNAEKSQKRDKAIKDYESYEKALILHKENEKSYKEKFKAYSIELERYQEEYSAQLQLAKAKVERHNNSIEAMAEEGFIKSMSAVKLELPEKFYGSIYKLINILEDLRADSLKEAINVLREDEHKENMLSEQRRLIDLQEEYNAELERQGEESARYQQEQNALERERIREGQRQHEAMMSFQREQARQQQELERKRYEEQCAYQREQERRQRDAELQEKERIRSIRNRCNMCANRFGCSIKNSITSACPSFRNK